MKERFQEIDDKNEALRDFLSTDRNAPQFLARYEKAWIYHDNALEGVIYADAELDAALRPVPANTEAGMAPAVLEIRNHKAAIEYVRHEAQTHAKKPLSLTVESIKHLHDLFIGNTPSALALRAQLERRERTEKELAKELAKSGFRRDMPLHRTYFHDIAQPGKIPGLLEKLAELTHSTEFKEFHPIKQAAVVQHQLLQIFPFSEHSGKVGRMSSNMYLLRGHYLPCIIHSIDRQRYYEAFRGNSSAFRLLLMDAIENSLDNALKFFREQARVFRAQR